MSVLKAAVRVLAIRREAMLKEPGAQKMEEEIWVGYSWLMLVEQVKDELYEQMSYAINE